MKRSQIQIESTKLCEICGKGLMKNIFLVYPCLHGYHDECLKEILVRIYKTKETIIACCYLCGDLNIRTIRDFYLDDPEEVESWNLPSKLNLFS